MKNILMVLVLFLFWGCDCIVPPTYTCPNRTFESSFESQSDFDGFYVENRSEYASAQELSPEQVKSGTYAHKAWITQARDTDNESTPTYLPHRAYPTVQFQKTTHGIYRTPALVTLWVYLDMTLTDRASGQIDDWFSFITLSPDACDSWSRTVLVNIAPDGFARLVHVPKQGEQNYIYQTSTAGEKFPYRQWVRLNVYIDFDATNGYAKVWQDGTLISHARVEGGKGGLAQAHFGLYASAALSNGTIYNDDLRIKEVANEAEAQTLIDGGN